MSASIHPNDADQGIEKHFCELMQSLMRNNPTARCYDLAGRRIPPLANYHPRIPSWWRSFHR